MQRVDAYRVRIPREGKMRTDGMIYADAKLAQALHGDGSLAQVAGVASLPGIRGCAMAMPDVHQGYGFPIGGVAAFDVDGGVISPGGVGYDINCGVRLLRSSLQREELEGRIEPLVGGLFASIPSGVGSRRRDLSLDREKLDGVLGRGAAWAVDAGFGTRRDLERIESGGCIPGADAGRVSERAKERGASQLGTLGSGNHFVEIGCAVEIFDPRAADELGLREGGVTVLVHTGSRGLGHQVCDDSIRVMLRAAERYGIELVDRQLCCAPVGSPEGRAYLAAMAAAANYAFANRQLITHWVRQTFERVYESSAAELGLELVYDVAHNMAKIERHEVDGKLRELCVHRKGATRAFPPGHAELPGGLRSLGQPVIIPGDMGRCSYVLLGTEQAYRETFGSACHGAGRRLSRHQAKKEARGRRIADELAARGIAVRCASRNTLSEEMPEAYKDVSDVVDVVCGAGIARKVARLVPLGVIKG
ncbi:MAG: RtcB family protein [Deltaproteobacteria bacterium]|nr:RtcB family protein [Deltaproteobacteria bacterium]